MRLIQILCIFGALMIVMESQATIRYAIILGSNHGEDENNKPPLEDLDHAESEAEVLRDNLVDLCGFSKDRTILLQGASRDEVMEQVKILKHGMEEDKKLGETDTIFAFFYTGHGQDGKLLLKDKPLTSDDIHDIFTTINATFSFGFFDACQSGSLNVDESTRKKKGIKPANGPFGELPENFLAIHGSIWFLSSKADQVSFEDNKLGGVFSYFFVEALKEADRQGLGIPLFNIMNYTKFKTKEHTKDEQQPYISIPGPTELYDQLDFSFPAERTSTIVFEKSVTGHFGVKYLDGNLSEIIEKEAGTEREFEVYPGNVVVSWFEEEQKIEREYNLESGDSLTLYRIKTKGTKSQSRTIEQGTTNAMQDPLQNDTLLQSRIIKHDTPIIMLGPSLDYTFAGAEVINPSFAVMLHGRLDWRQFSFALSAGYGFNKQKWDAWSYEIQAFKGELQLGYGLDIGQTRLTSSLNFGLSHSWKSFNTDIQNISSGWSYAPGIRLGIVFPTRGWFVFELYINGGLLISKGAELGGTTVVTGGIGGGLGVMYRFD